MGTYNNYNNHHHQQQMILQNTNFSALVRPNIERVCATAKLMVVLSGLMIPFGFFMFAFAGFSAAESQTMGFPPLIPVAMLIFMGGGIMTGVFSVRLAKYNQLKNFIGEIKGHDKISIDSLTLSKYIGKSSVLLLIKRLIQTKNLADYEIIGEVGVAKKSLHATTRDFASRSDNAAPVNAHAPVEGKKRDHRCPGCGTAITHAGRFCDFCGTRLD